jgi:hypothetical protein
MVYKQSDMNKPSLPRCAFLSATLIFAGAIAASAGDRFSMVVGSHDLLTVLNAKGERKALLPLPSISQAVVVDGATCQISYGRDANNLLTAIIAPNPTEPQDLHFTVLGKAIDTDRSAVVTLTFSKNLNSVKIDPGYVGDVEVNSQRMQRDTAASRHMQHAPLIAYSTTPSPSPQSALNDGSQTASTDPVISTPSKDSAKPAISSSPSASAPATAVQLPVPTPQTPIAANQAANTLDPSEAGNGRVSDHAPDPLQANSASQMPFTATATPGPSTVGVVGSDTAPKQHSLYWSEPVTPPNGVAPQCGADQMKLVEINGPVSVTAPGGDSHDGTVGMLVPSGSTISTSGGSSAAIFMGGINSVRLMPDTEVQITQQVSSSSRKTVVALHQGTIFNRVGHRDGETQNYQVESPEGVAVAKGTEFADSLANGHHYVFVVKGIVAMIMHDIQTGTLTSVPGSVASGAMPPATNGDKILFAVLTALQPFQPYLQKVIADINAGTASPAELGYYNGLKQTFTVLVDDVYDPTHPNAFLGAFTSGTGFGDSIYSPLVRPQDFGTTPNNLILPSHEADTHPFVTPAVTPTFSNEIPPGSS